MKDFLITTLPWMIAVTCVCFSVVVYLMFLRSEEQCKNLLKHWDESIRINKLACQHIVHLEAQLKRAQEPDFGEGWKNL